jgi:hypothetical protein
LDDIGKENDRTGSGLLILLEGPVEEDLLELGQVSKTALDLKDQESPGSRNLRKGKDVK